MSRYDHYSPQAMDVLYTVQDIVRKEGRDQSLPEDLSKALLISAIPELLKVARTNNRVLNRDKIKTLYISLNGLTPKSENGTIQLSPHFRAILDDAEKLAGADAVKVEHLLHAAWPSVEKEMESYFEPERMGLSTESATLSIPELERGEAQSDTQPQEASMGPAGEPGSLFSVFDYAQIKGEAERPAPGAEKPQSAIGANKAKARAKGEELFLPELEQSPERAKALEFLGSVGRELTDPAKHFEIYARQREIDSLVSILLRYFKPNPLIIGEPGVGKTALVEGLAERVKSGQVPSQLRGNKIYEVRLSELAAGTTVHGAYEEKLKTLVQVMENNPDIIVFLDEMHQATQSYANEPTADILKPALSSGKFRCIGATTVSDFHRFLERDEAFVRRFQTVLVKEPDKETTLTILNGLRPRLEKHFRVDLPLPLLERAFGVAHQHLTTRFFPDKAIDILDRACSKACFEGRATVGEADILSAVSDLANVRFDKDNPESLSVDGIEERVFKDIVGQDEAVTKVASVLRVCKRHLDLRPERPDGVFLFTGPTGVGKTALAQSIAYRLTGREDALFRIDMSEFSESHTIARLLGAPPGYIGYGDIALLSSAVEKNPSGVLLLDEFEKAHPQVHRLFLQIFDSGRATDSFGKPLVFSNMTIIATCNVRSGSLSPIGFETAAPGAKAVLPMAELKRVFLPELLNRFDALIPFRALTRGDCAHILRDILIPKNNANLIEEYDFSLSYSDALLERVLDEGFSEEFGARNLQRAFQEIVVLPMAGRIDEFRGRGAVQVELCDSGAVFRA
jgi:ATP-dependent Clp protease ATP-binding subunit ClpC